MYAPNQQNIESSVTLAKTIAATMPPTNKQNTLTQLRAQRKQSTGYSNKSCIYFVEKRRSTRLAFERVVAITTIHTQSKAITRNDIYIFLCIDIQICLCSYLLLWVTVIIVNIIPIIISYCIVAVVLIAIVKLLCTMFVVVFVIARCRVACYLAKLQYLMK